MHWFNRVIAKPVRTLVVAIRIPYAPSLAPLCKGSCHEVTEGLSAVGMRKRRLVLLSVPSCGHPTGNPSPLRGAPSPFVPYVDISLIEGITPYTGEPRGRGRRIATTSVRTGLAMTRGAAVRRTAPGYALRPMRRTAPRAVRRTAPVFAPAPRAGNCALCTVNCALV